MQLLRRLSFTMLLMSMMTLVACGGGDLSGGDDGDDGSTDIITLTLTKSDGELSAANDIIITATVLDDGSPVSNKTVNFNLAVDGSATIDPISGTSTTDESGNATITIKVSDVKGSVNVIASYASASDDISFNSLGDGDGGNDSGTQLSLTKSSGDLSLENDITIAASLLYVDGTGLEGKLVSFTINDPTIATFASDVSTAVTNAAGQAEITVKVTDIAGAVEITATAVSDDETDTTVKKIAFVSIGDGVKVVEGEPDAASLRLFASTQQLASSGAQSIALFAIAKDVNNNLIEGITINFASSSGSLVNVVNENGESSNVTGADGKVTMELSTQDEPSNRVITVTVTAGEITDELEIEVVGTSITLTGSASLALNDEATYIVNVLDSDGNGVAATDVAVSLSGTDAEITLPSSVITDSSGQAIIQATGSSGGQNTIVVSALGASASQNVSVQSDSFQFTSFEIEGTDVIEDPSSTPVLSDVSINQTAKVTLTWLRDGSPVPNTPISITTTRGEFSLLPDPLQTNSSGQITVSMTSSDAGKALVTLVGSDTVNDEDIELTNQLEFEFYAETAATIIAQASPNSIGPNEQTSVISVIVKDDNGNLVKNKKIKFLLTDISGGSISPATAVTNSSGSASTIYTSNSTSAKDGVSIAAVVDDTSSISDTTTLTVSDRELFISLGTGNELEESGTTDYIKEYSVFVTDADSNAVENVALTISAIPESYYKGFWIRVYDEEEFQTWAAVGYGSTIENNDTTIMVPTTQCSNEDINNNGVLDDGEDTNGDGELTPGNIAAISGTFLTDSDGRSIIRVNYSQSYGHWVDLKLVVSGRVTGSEGSTQTIFKLPALSGDITVEDINPPQQGIKSRGPFGVEPDCLVPISGDPVGNAD